MGKNKNLNGLPGNLALSYLSTLRYYNDGYMADWLNFIAHEKNIKEINIDILNNKIEPEMADIKPLKAYLNDLRKIIEKELLSNGFEINFIKHAKLEFQIPIDDSEFRNTVYCNPILEDINGKIYKTKKRIVEIAYEDNFNPLKY